MDKVGQGFNGNREVRVIMLARLYDACNSFMGGERADG